MSSSPLNFSKVAQVPGPVLDLLEAEINFIWLSNAGRLAFSVLYLYDFILTLESEIKSIWQRKFSGLTWLFLISRYGFLAYLFLTTVLPFVPEITLRTYNIIYVFEVVTLNVASAALFGIFILRTHAIWGFRRIIIVLLLPFLIANIGCTIYNEIKLLHQAESSQLTVSCKNGNCSIPSELVYSLPGGIIGLAFDLMVFGLTLYRTATLEANQSNVKSSLMRFLLRDGSLYFGVLSMLRVSVILTTTISSTPELLNIMSSSALDPIQAIILNRLVLNLRTHSTQALQSNENSLYTEDLRTRTDIEFRMPCQGEDEQGHDNGYEKSIFYSTRDVRGQVMEKEGTNGTGTFLSTFIEGLDGPLNP